MAVPAFDPKELTVVEERPGFFGGPPVQVFSYPLKPREAVIKMFEREPAWQMSGMEQMVMFSPKANPDNVARAFVFDGAGDPPPPADVDIPDMFGINWVYVPQVGGSMVRPGKPLMEDANEWEEKVVWPDLETWDWATSVERAKKQFANATGFVSAWILNGWYERLISFMDFENAIMAVFDEDQKDAVHAFFDKLSDFYIKMIDKYLLHFPQIDGFCFHDDWGSQKETFFSPAVVEEMIVPYMRRVTDYLHSKGKFAELHSCGQILKQVPNMIAAGWDLWHPQPMNDTHKIYELYGDKILVGVMPERFDPEKTTEEEQRAAAREYAKKFCDPKKPSVLSLSASPLLTKAFREELYKQSRINYSK